MRNIFKIFLNSVYWSIMCTFTKKEKKDTRERKRRNGKREEDVVFRESLSFTLL